MRILLTTSRRPSRRTRSFLKDLSLILRATKFNRGKSSIEDILSRMGEEERLVIVDTKKGNPSRLRIYAKQGLMRTYLIRRVKLLREIDKGLLKKRFKINANDELSKDFCEALCLKDDNEGEVSLSFSKVHEEKFKDYEKIELLEDNKVLGVLFYIKKLP